MCVQLHNDGAPSWAAAAGAGLRVTIPLLTVECASRVSYVQVCTRRHRPVQLEPAVAAMDAACISEAARHGRRRIIGQPRRLGCEFENLKRCVKMRDSG